MMIPKKLRYTCVLFLFLVIPLAAFGRLRLPKLVNDGMVLQRGAVVKIWGWAEKNEKVSVRFIDSFYQTVSDDSGKWEVKLPPMKEGGPYSMTVHAGDTIIIQNIVVGDVWVCSGQSNMEIPMSRVRPLYEKDIAESENPFIRYFTLPQTYNFCAPQNDISSGTWHSVHPKNILSFSAIAYFFAKELYEKYRVPIGLIQTSIGGTPAEAWMSEDALKEFPVYYRELQRVKDRSVIDSIELQDKGRIQTWYGTLHQSDKGYKDPQNLWYDTTFQSADWDVMSIPCLWDTTALKGVNGVVWFKKEIILPASAAGQAAKLFLGRIVDADSVFVNGIFIGSTGYQYPPRRYTIPGSLLKEGKNSIVVRLISNCGSGGFIPDKPYELIVNGETMNLQGLWQYRLGAAMEPLAGETFVKYKPAGLFNAMIAPLFHTSIKGVIWYQGESNAERPVEYRKLFPALIRDWRKHWGGENFPFLYVQLPNYMEAKKEPSESNWALFREAQMNALSLPRTGMAVAIDLGEWNDIHPLNKKDVGVRLALAARSVAYGEKKIISSGPLFHSMKIKGNKAILTFKSIGSGLRAKGGGELKCFAIAGKDLHFVWAKAMIQGGKVVVWNEKVRKPAAVRYAWADNPDGANLINKEGLPASPFRTDRQEK